MPNQWHPLFYINDIQLITTRFEPQIFICKKMGDKKKSKKVCR